MTCSDIIEHIRKEHGFSESNIKDTLKTNSNFYKNSFEKIK
jgi:predicted small metal-binding protein